MCSRNSIIESHLFAEKRNPVCLIWTAYDARVELMRRNDIAEPVKWHFSTPMRTLGPFTQFSRWILSASRSLKPPLLNKLPCMKKSKCVPQSFESSDVMLTTECKCWKLQLRITKCWTLSFISMNVWHLENGRLSTLRYWMVSKLTFCSIKQPPMSLLVRA